MPFQPRTKLFNVYDAMALEDVKEYQIEMKQKSKDEVQQKRNMAAILQQQMKQKAQRENELFLQSKLKEEEVLQKDRNEFNVMKKTEEIRRNKELQAALENKMESTARQKKEVAESGNYDSGLNLKSFEAEEAQYY